MPEMGEMRALAQQESIVALYAALAGTVRAMLAAARAEDWDLLVMLESDCAAHVAALQREEPLSLLLQQQLSEQQCAQKDQRKGELLTRMLADDGELRRLVAARMAQLSNKMSSASTERKLSRAYGA